MNRFNYNNWVVNKRKRGKTIFCIGSVCIFCFGIITEGNTQNIMNGSFESAQNNPGGTFIQLSNGNNTIDNWKIENGTIDYIGGFWQASDGARSIDINGTSAGSISQSFNTSKGDKYFIKFDLSGNSDCGRLPLIKTILVSAASTSQTFDFNVSGNSHFSMGWETKSFEFLADSSTTTLKISSLDPGTFCGAAIDNIRQCDCAGIPNGTALIDECGNCLDPSDPNFNQTCVDCNGIPDGIAVMDECGVCLEPTNPNFNRSCEDCNGKPNGTAIMDDCGQCLEPFDPSFNQLCNNKRIFYIPNAFSPNQDGVNDKFQISFHNRSIKSINEYRIFDRWGALIFEKVNIEPLVFNDWWDGSFNGRILNSDIYVYFIEIEFLNGEIVQYTGDLILIK